MLAVLNWGMGLVKLMCCGCAVPGLLIEGEDLNKQNCHVQMESTLASEGDVCMFQWNEDLLPLFLKKH